MTCAVETAREERLANRAFMRALRTFLFRKTPDPDWRAAPTRTLAIPALEVGAFGQLLRDALRLGVTSEHTAANRCNASRARFHTWITGERLPDADETARAIRALGLPRGSWTLARHERALREERRRNAEVTR